MNVQYDFTETGGFPLDQDVLKDLQNGALLTETALANLLGPLVIISGCAVAGGSAANGVVAVRGQILPFIGGVITAKVIIVEADTDDTYFTGAINPSIITRYVTFGDDGVQNNPWVDFVSVTPEGVLADVTGIWQTGDVKEVDCDEAYITANFDGTGLGINLRVGWAICNGNNGTVNRLGKVPVQRDAAETQFAAMGDTGGAKTYTILATDLPELETENTFNASPGGTPVFSSSTGTPRQVNVNVGSPNNPISLLQPYITTLFIQKL